MVATADLLSCWCMFSEAPKQPPLVVIQLDAWVQGKVRLVVDRDYTLDQYE